MMMRTTLNLDADVAAQVRMLAQRDARSFSRVANDLIRAGLRHRQAPPRTTPYEPPVVDTGRVYLDVTDIGAALDVLDQEP